MTIEKLSFLHATDVEEKTEPTTSCCPPLSPLMTQCVPKAKGCKLTVIWGVLSKVQTFHFHRVSDILLALDDDAELNQMHITLALNYDKCDSATLSTLFGRFENVDASSWELRLYSRDVRIGSKQVRLFLFQPINCQFSVVK